MAERKLSPLALEAEERLKYEEGRLLAIAGDSREGNLLLTRLLPLAGARDRGTKLRAYLLIDPKGWVEVYRKTEGGVHYEVHREGRILLDCPPGALDLGGFFP